MTNTEARTNIPRRFWRNAGAVLLAASAWWLLPGYGGAEAELAKKAEVASAKTALESLDPTDFVWRTVEPLDIHPRTSLTILEQLRHNHYLDKSLNDSLSSRIFDKYLDSLDGSRSYFFADDIRDFESYRTKLDDALKRGNLDPAFRMFNRYQNRAIERLEFLLRRLEQPLTTADFLTEKRPGRPMRRR
jgi:carboxyl-terminal processing protease